MPRGKSEKSQSPPTEDLGILMFILKDTYSFKTAHASHASHASQAAAHSTGALVTEMIVQKL